MLELSQIATFPRVNYSSNVQTTPFDLSMVKWFNQSDIEIVRFLDEGRFSSVFVGEDTRSHREVVIKVLHPTYLGKVKREIRMLRACQRLQYFIKLFGVVKCQSLRTVALILESLGAEVECLGHHAIPLNTEEVKHYMRCLLTGLKECHQLGIMHRDIKNRNIMVNRDSRELRIIDLGLSEMYVPNKQYNPSVCSKSFKGSTPSDLTWYLMYLSLAPELLLDYLYYDFAIDIWGAGCVFAGLLFRREPFFAGSDKTEVLRSIAAVVGSLSIRSWTQKYNIRVNTAMNRAVGNHSPTSWSALKHKENAELCSDEALDLLSHMLEVDHHKRYTAEECLRHPYLTQ